MDESKDKEPEKSDVDCEKGFQGCGSRCTEMEEKSEKSEDRLAVLALEIEKKKRDYELLGAKFKALEVENLAMEDEVKVLKRRNDELEGMIAKFEDQNKVGYRTERVQGVVDLTEDDEETNKTDQLMIENTVLECEKKNAEHEIEVWKEKFRELESRLICLEKDNLILREKQYSLSGRREEELGLPDMVSHQGFEARTGVVNKPKDGSCVEISPGRVQTKKMTMDFDETIPASPGNGMEHLQATAGTPCIDTPYKHSVHVKGEKGCTHLQTEVALLRSRVRQQLSYGDDGSPNKKMAPSTPGGARPASVGIIDISDGDDEPDITSFQLSTPEIHGNKMACVSRDRALGGAVSIDKGMISENSLKRILSDQSDEEDMSGCKRNIPFSTTPKRKRASNMVTSDSESDDSDNVPISELMKKPIQESIHNPKESHVNSYSTGTVSRGNAVPESQTPRRRRLVTLRECEETGGTETSENKYQPGFSTNEDAEDDVMEEVESESEGDSLGGFIVDSSQSSDVSDRNGAFSESEDVSDSNVDFNEILSGYRRNRDQNSKWEFEADMLAAFGKDPELCMKAVCALYRQQTTDEKSVKATIHSNQRGFSQCDAPRGTALAEFLTDGDPQGDLKKSVKELQEYNPKGLKLCRTLATHYSKQLFAIYNNNEDPYFRIQKLSARS